MNRIGEGARKLTQYDPPGKSEEPSKVGVRPDTVKGTQVKSPIESFQTQLDLYPPYSEDFNYVVDLAKSALKLIEITNDANSKEDHSEILSTLKEKPGFTAGVFRHLNTINGYSDQEQSNTFNQLLPYLNLKDKKPEGIQPPKTAIENLINYKCPQGVMDAFVDAVNNDTSPENNAQNFYKEFDNDTKMDLNELIYYKSKPVEDPSFKLLNYDGIKALLKIDQADTTNP